MALYASATLKNCLSDPVLSQKTGTFWQSQEYLTGVLAGRVHSHRADNKSKAVQARLPPPSSRRGGGPEAGLSRGAHTWDSERVDGSVRFDRYGG